MSSRSKDIGSQMSLMGDKMFKYILKFSLRFTECFYEIICLYQFRSSLSHVKRHLKGAMMLNKTSMNRSSSKAVGVCKGGMKFDKNDLSPAVQKI